MGMATDSVQEAGAEWSKEPPLLHFRLSSRAFIPKQLRHEKPSRPSRQLALGGEGPLESGEPSEHKTPRRPSPAGYEKRR